MLKEMILKERIDEDEIFAIIRQSGLGSIDEVDAVVLESVGTLTVIKQLKNIDDKIMERVEKSVAAGL
jgi:uncharacterized membrane protein YcaP (DUF421 family)